MQHLKGVPGGVAGGQHQCIAGEIVGTALGHDRDGGQLPAVTAERPELVLKTDVCAQGQQFLPDGFHHAPEHIGADMGLVGPLDVVRGPVGDKDVEDVGDAGVVHSGGELAVGEGARAPLAELDVGGVGQLAGLPEMLHILCTLIHVPAPLQYDGPQARPGQGEGGEQPRRTHPHHYRGQGRGSADGGKGIGGVRNPDHAPKGTAEDGVFLIV